MTEGLQHVIASYEAARRWMQQLRDGGGRRKKGNAARAFTSLQELSVAVFDGQVEFGDLVTGSGWLSLYASWYLPSAYSPYHLSVTAAALETRWMVKTSPSPSLLPAGQLPFAFKEQVVGFIYPSDTSGFAGQLLPDNGESRFGTPVRRTSSEDNPWIISLDNGSGTCNPMSWTFTLGDSALESMLLGEAPDIAIMGEELGVSAFSASSSHEGAPIFSDPALVRRAARVPLGSQPIPIVFPPGFERNLHSDVQFTARIARLDSEVLAELSQLGQPLTDKSFALFTGGAKSQPFCLRVEGDGCNLQPTSQSSQQEPTSNTKLCTLLVEWYFEDPQTGLPVPFDDELLLSWFIPCAKNYVPAHGNYVLPTRWAGKLYGFDGALYFFNTGTVEFTMSPHGFFTATQVTTFDARYQGDWTAWKQIVTELQRDLIERFRTLHGRTLILRTTYLTDWNWMAQFGNVLEGRAIWKTVQENLREHHQAAEFMRALQASREAQENKKTMRPIKVLFVSSNPVDQPSLQLDRELRDIKERIKLAKHRNLLQVEHISAARPQDILQAFNEHEVDIFHFSGHGAESGELGLCAANGSFHPLRPEALANLMQVLGKKVQVAVINACYSQAQAEAIRAHVPCAIGMNAPIGDEAAIVFASSFYSALAFGHNVENAFEQGVIALQMENIDEDKTPELLVKDGILASQVTPVQDPATTIYGTS